MRTFELTFGDVHISVRVPRMNPAYVRAILAIIAIAVYLLGMVALAKSCGIPGIVLDGFITFFGFIAIVCKASG